MKLYHRKLMLLHEPKMGVDIKLPKGPKPKTLAPPLTHHHYLIAIIALASFLVALLFLCVSIYFVLRSRKNRNPAQPDDENLVFAENDLFVVDRIQGPTEEEEDHHVWHIRTVGLPESVISSIAEFKYEKRGEGSFLDCPVCLSEFEEDERVKLLPECVHAFHSECIDSWLRSHKNCPVCRAPVVIVAGSSGEGRKLRVVSDLGDYGRVRNVMIHHDQEFVNKVRRSNSMS